MRSSRPSKVEAVPKERRSRWQRQRQWRTRPGPGCGGVSLACRPPIPTQSVRIVAPGVPDSFGSGPGPRSLVNDTISTALQATPSQLQQSTALTPGCEAAATCATAGAASAATAGPFPAAVPSGPAPPGPAFPNLPQTGTATPVWRNGGYRERKPRPPPLAATRMAWNFGQNAGAVTTKLSGGELRGSTVGGRGGTFSTPAAIQSATIPANRAERHLLRIR